mgnify:FL=1
MSPPAKKREISVIERRLQSGQIFALGSDAIPLREPTRWVLRIINTQISDAHLWSMQAKKGWVYAEPDDLAVKAEEIGFRVQDGRIVRGTQGAEVLMKMASPDFAAVQRQKDAENRAHTFGAKALKASVVKAAETKPDDPDAAKGAEFLDRHLAGITVTDSVERVPLDE